MVHGKRVSCRAQGERGSPWQMIKGIECGAARIANAYHVAGVPQKLVYSPLPSRVGA